MLSIVLVKQHCLQLASILLIIRNIPPNCNPSTTMTLLAVDIERFQNEHMQVIFQVHGPTIQDDACSHLVGFSLKRTSLKINLP